MEVRDNSKQTKTAAKNKPVNDREKGKAKKYTREYMKGRRADDNFKKNMRMKNEYKAATLIGNI